MSKMVDIHDELDGYHLDGTIDDAIQKLQELKSDHGWSSETNIEWVWEHSGEGPLIKLHDRRPETDDERRIRKENEKGEAELNRLRREADERRAKNNARAIRERDMAELARLKALYE